MTAMSPTGAEWRQPVVEPIGPESIANTAAAGTTGERQWPVSQRLPSNEEGRMQNAESGCPSEWIRLSVLSWHPILFP
jgi:hypothetical protein